jgi:hypothetical protein
MKPSSSDKPILKRRRVRIGLFLNLVGLFLFLLGAQPGWFGLDRSPVVGFVQIAVFLVGLGVICLGGYICLHGLWIGRERTIASDIGLRLVGTGYVIAVFSGMADFLGMGSQLTPETSAFGFFQMLGVLIGQIIIAGGFILMLPFPSPTLKD